MGRGPYVASSRSCSGPACGRGREHILYGLAGQRWASPTTQPGTNGGEQMTPTGFVLIRCGPTDACRAGAAGAAATQGRRARAATALPGGVAMASRKARTCADGRLTHQETSGSLRYRKSINVLLTVPCQEVS